ncbi:hypothetical protein DPMN_188195 [Dreissena polymorpha]|uniref:Uncharacterized protein n=1 Tax=Dreissena polymorpha TaxID=45954 RepID=A0A9D4DS01_DREPO|nr:hypothetical protein DPMN_188195 [Dreissena polymorpha]
MSCAECPTSYPLDHAVLRDETSSVNLLNPYPLDHAAYPWDEMSAADTLCSYPVDHAMLRD